MKKDNAPKSRYIPPYIDILDVDTKDAFLIGSIVPEEGVPGDEINARGRYGDQSMVNGYGWRDESNGRTKSKVGFGNLW